MSLRVPSLDLLAGPLMGAGETVVTKTKTVTTKKTLA